MFEGKIKFFGDQSARRFAEQTFDKIKNELQTRAGRMIFLCGDDDLSAQELAQQPASRMKFCQGDDDLRVGEDLQADGSLQTKDELHTENDLQHKDGFQAGDNLQAGNAFWTNKLGMQKSERLCLRHPKESQNETAFLQRGSKAVQNNTSFGQNGAKIAQNVHIQLLALGEAYRALQTLAQSEGIDQNVQNQLSQMQSELEVVTFAMGRVCQNLASGVVPRANRDNLPMRDFCSGLFLTQKMMRQILWDLRDLQRKIDNDGMQIQIFIIYLTLLSQEGDLKEFSALC